jgi:hypothetical protein
MCMNPAAPEMLDSAGTSRHEPDAAERANLTLNWRQRLSEAGPGERRPQACASRVRLSSSYDHAASA